MVIESYNSKWPQQFILIKQMLERNLREYISIEHVGSTSIPGMKAKPIIDIDVVVQDKAQFLLVKEDLEKIGYVYKGDLGISGREAFDEDNVSIKIAHHLYVCKKDNPELLRHIAFRNRLRETPALVQEYNSIKEEILLKVGTDNRAAYVDMKEKEYKWFFEKVLQGN
ncbi:MAG: GrpB family protein [Treponema sp.]|nr:GrpB family protein [Treponema sp.]